MCQPCYFPGGIPGTLKFTLLPTRIELDDIARERRVWEKKKALKANSTSMTSWFMAFYTKLFWVPFSFNRTIHWSFRGAWNFQKGKKWGRGKSWKKDKMITTYLLPLKSGNCKNCPFRFHRVTIVGNPSSTVASQLKRTGLEKSLDNIVKSVGSVRNRNPENRWERKPAIKKEGRKGKQSSLINWITGNVSLPFFGKTSSPPFRVFCALP